jgi:hypothetical protein
MGTKIEELSEVESDDGGESAGERAVLGWAVILTSGTIALGFQLSQLFLKCSKSRNNRCWRRTKDKTNQ